MLPLFSALGSFQVAEAKGARPDGCSFSPAGPERDFLLLV